MDYKKTFTGGEPDMTEDDFLRIQESNQRFVNNFLDSVAGATNFIISNCSATLTAGVEIEVDPGYIYLNGEIVEVELQTVADTEGTDLYEYVLSDTYEAGGNKTYIDGTPRQTWQKKRGIVTSVAVLTPGNLDVQSLERLSEKTKGGYASKVLEIGDWDMVASGQAAIVHGITGSFAIIGVDFIIRADGGGAWAQNSRYPSGIAGGLQANLLGWDGTHATIERVSAGWYDSTNYDETSYNRGYIKINYIRV